METDVVRALEDFLSNNNKTRQQAEILYSKLENLNINQLITELIKIIIESPDRTIGFSALIRMSQYLITAIQEESFIDKKILMEIHNTLLEIIHSDRFPIELKKYVISCLEDYLYVCENNDNSWPELVPCFLKFLKEENCLEHALSFFCIFAELNIFDEVSVIIQSYLSLDHPNEDIRAISFKIVVISLFCKPKKNPMILEFPTFLASLSDMHFSQSFSVLWSLFKKEPTLFKEILSELFGLLLMISSDPTRSQLQRRDALFFFQKMLKFSPKIKKLSIKSSEQILSILASLAANPLEFSDVYDEAKETLSEYIKIVSYDIDNLPEQLQVHVNDKNPYISSLFMTCTRDFRNIQLAADYSMYADTIIRMNGIQILSNNLVFDTDIIGKTIYDGLRSEFWFDFLDLFIQYSYEATHDSLIEIASVLNYLIHTHDNPMLIYSLSIICSKYPAETKPTTLSLFELVVALFKNNKIYNEVLESIPYLLSSLTTKDFLPFLNELIPMFCSSLECLTSKSILKMMRVIGVIFVQYIDRVIQALLKFGSESNEEYEIASCIEAITNIISIYPNNISDQLVDILNLAMKYGEFDDSDVIKITAIGLTYQILEISSNNQVVIKQIYDFISQRIQKEQDSDCFELIISLEIKYVGQKIVDEENLLFFLDTIPYILSKAVEEDSKQLYVCTASLFVNLLKQIPDSATTLFFQLQKLIPHYNSTESTENMIRFSLMTWTDFVTFGPENHIQQYIAGVAKDLYNILIKNENEKLMKVAVICVLSYCMEKERPINEVSAIMDAFNEVLTKKPKSFSLNEITISAFTQILQKYYNEAIFPLRMRQILEALPLKRVSDESDLIYRNLFNFMILAINNLDIRFCAAAISAQLYYAFDKSLISNSLKLEMVTEMKRIEKTLPILEFQQLLTPTPVYDKTHSYLIY